MGCAGTLTRKLSLIQSSQKFTPEKPENMDIALVTYKPKELKLWRNIQLIMVIRKLSTHNTLD